MKRAIHTILGVVTTLLLLSSCNNEKRYQYDYDYLPAQMSKGENWSIIDRNGKVVVEEEYPADAELSPIQEGVYWVRTSGGCQLFSIQQPKKPLTDAEYAMATEFRAGRAVVSNPNHPIQIVDTNGKVVATLAKNIKRCYTFSDDGYAVFETTDDKKGLLNTDGKVVLKAEYEELNNVSDGVTLAKKKTDDSKCLIINPKGKKLGEVNTEQYYLFNPEFHEGKLLVQKADDEDYHTVVLDKTGKKLFDIRKAKEKYTSARYEDGYKVFYNGEKFGLVDEKGEVVIRAKYDNLVNIGKQRFCAQKGDKWGVVNAEDETCLDFDFGRIIVTMGENYVALDGDEVILIDPKGKELVSMHRVMADANRYAEYVDVDGLSTQLVKAIEDFEHPLSAAEAAKKFGLNVDDCKYQRSVVQPLDINGKITSTVYYRWEDYIAQEKTHTEKVDDGWFTYNRTVSDGYQWANVLPESVTATLNINDNAIDTEILYRSLCSKLANGRTKILDGVFSKKVNVNGKTLKCQTQLDNRDSEIGLIIAFFAE